MIRNKNNISKKNFFLLVLFLISDLFFLYLIKYKNQSLSLSDFNIATFGNIGNLFFYVLLLLGLLIVFRIRTFDLNIKVFNLIFIINQVLLMSSYLATIISLPFDNFYYLTQNGNRLFVGLIFTLYQYSFFILIFLVWLNILRVRKLILLRSILNSAWLMLFLLFISFIFIIISENNIGANKLASKKNYVAIVLGAAVWSDNKPSPTLAARVDKSLELYDEGIVSSIFLTGGNAPGELSESEVAFNYIKSIHNEIDNILIESKTTSTNEQLQFIKNELLSKNDKNNVIVISDSYHLVRIEQISNFHNIKIDVVSSDLPLSFEKALYFKVREALALLVFWFFAL